MTILVLMNGEGHSLRDLQSADYFEGYVWDQRDLLSKCTYLYRTTTAGPWTLFFGSTHSTELPANLDLSLVSITGFDANYLRGRILAGLGGAYYWLGWRETDALGYDYASWPGELYRVFADAPPQLLWSGTRPAGLYSVSVWNHVGAPTPVTVGPEHAWLEFDGTNLTYFDMTSATTGEIVTFASGGTYSSASFTEVPTATHRDVSPGSFGAATGGASTLMGVTRSGGAKLPGLQAMSYELTLSNDVLVTLSDGSTRNIPSTLFGTDVNAMPQMYNGVDPVEEPPAIWQDFVGAAKEWPY